MYLNKRAYLLLEVPLVLLALMLGIEGCKRTIEEVQPIAEQAALKNLQLVYVRDLPDQDFLILWQEGKETTLDQGKYVRKPLVKEGYALYVKDGDLWLIQLYNESEPQLVAEGELTEQDETDWRYFWSPVPGSMDFVYSDGGSIYAVYDVWDPERKIGPTWFGEYRLAGWDIDGIWRACQDWENGTWKAQVVDKGGRLIGEQELKGEDWKEETEKLIIPPFSKDPLKWTVKPEEIYRVSSHANSIWAVSRSGNKVELVTNQGMETIETFDGRDASVGPTRDLRP